VKMEMTNTSRAISTMIRYSTEFIFYKLLSFSRWVNNNVNLSLAGTDFSSIRIISATHIIQSILNDTDLLKMYIEDHIN
jgi:hypothetical protein